MSGAVYSLNIQYFLKLLWEWRDLQHLTDTGASKVKKKDYTYVQILRPIICLVLVVLQTYTLINNDRNIRTKKWETLNRIPTLT